MDLFIPKVFQYHHTVFRDLLKMVSSCGYYFVVLIQNKKYVYNFFGFEQCVSRVMDSTTSIHSKMQIVKLLIT